MEIELSAEQMERYSRQLMLPEIDVAGQKKLAQSRVLVIGAGGLGSPAALYLAAAGIGTIGIVDGDRVELSNLQRQIVHNQSRLGISKAESAASSLRELNQHVRVIPYAFFAEDNTILQLIQEYDFVLDTSDQVENKFLINDACVLGKKPFCHGGILGFCGQVMTYVPEKGPCYRCVFEDLPAEDQQGKKPFGVIGMTAGIAGTIQALEAVKYLLGIGTLLTGRMLTFDGLYMQFRTITLPNASTQCRVCGTHADIHNLDWYQKYRHTSQYNDRRE